MKNPEKLRYISSEITEFISDVDMMMVKYGLPAAWFSRVDHLAISAGSREDLRTLLGSLHAEAKGAVFVNSGDNEYPVIELRDDLPLDDYRSVSMIKLVAHKEQVAQQLEYIAFYHKNLYQVVNRKSRPSINESVGSDEQHNWVSMFTPGGREARFVSRSLADIVAKQGIDYISIALSDSEAGDVSES